MRYEHRRRTLNCRETALVSKGGMDQVVNTVLNFKNIIIALLIFAGAYGRARGFIRRDSNMDYLDLERWIFIF